MRLVLADAFQHGRTAGAADSDETGGRWLNETMKWIVINTNSTLAKTSRTNYIMDRTQNTDRRVANEIRYPDSQTWGRDLSLQDATLVSVMRASHGINACVETLLRREGLTELSFHLLIIVMSGGSDSVALSLLRDQVGQTSANMTRIIHLLHSKKLVTVTTDGVDRRRKKLGITALGRRSVKRCTARLATSITAAMNGLSAQDRRIVERLLRALSVSTEAADRI